MSCLRVTVLPPDQAFLRVACDPAEWLKEWEVRPILSRRICEHVRHMTYADVFVECCQCGRHLLPADAGTLPCIAFCR